MQIITYQGIAVYAFDDAVVLDIQSDKIITPEFIIGDLHSGNALLYSNVTTTPEDFTGGKYCYDGAVWSANTNWVE